MKARLLTVFLLLPLLPLGGCGSGGGKTPTGPPYPYFLVGTWKEKEGHTTLVFSENDRFIEKRRGKLGSGTWDLQGHKLYLTITKFDLGGSALEDLKGSYTMSISIRGLTMHATIDCLSIRVRPTGDSLENAQTTAASVEADMKSDCQAGPVGTLVKQI